MFIDRRIILFLSLNVLLFITSCSIGKYNRDKINNSEYYQPVFKENGGKKSANFINKLRVIRETEYMVVLAALKKAREAGSIKPPPRGSTVKLDSTDIEINAVSLQIQYEIDNLYKELGTIDPLDDNSHKTCLSVLTKINDLYYKKINPYKIFRNKTINELEGDFSFKTGKSQLKEEGINEVQKLINNFESEIKEWKNYTDDHNQKIFENDRYKLTVQINGYADKQGSEETNLKLYHDRAKEVREVFINQFKKLNMKYSINLSINFAEKGELLPAGVIDNGKNDDPKRRICVVSSILGPLRLITANDAK